MPLKFRNVLDYLIALLSKHLSSGGGHDCHPRGVCSSCWPGLWFGGASNTTWRLPLLSVGKERASGMEECPGRPLSALAPSQGPQEGLGAPPGSVRSSCPMADLAFFSVLSYLVRNRTLGPPLENNPKTPPSSRDEGLRLLHGLETNLATSLQTPQEA